MTVVCEPAPKAPPVFTVETLAPEDAPVHDLALNPRVQRDDLSADQVVVYDEIVKWASDPNGRSHLSMGGYAGTGKTTVTAAVAGALCRKFHIGFCAFTGRAAGVLGRKLAENGLGALDCSTIHSMIYRADIDPKTGECIGFTLRPSEDVPYDLFVVDEASMLSKDLWDALQTYGRRILLVGDHGQLAPIGDNPGLMQKPDLRLEKIHRQAADNPILAFAAHVRGGGNPRYFRASDSRVSTLRSAQDIAGRLGLDSAAICFRNQTRNSLNQAARAAQGFHGPVPDPNEVLICLKNKKQVIYNGMRGTLRWADYNLDKYQRLPVVVDFRDENLRMWGRLNISQFGRDKTYSRLDEIPGTPKSWDSAGMLFDFGYAMTCHKAQGSQFREVTVLVERWLGKTEDDRRRWLYTAATRASEQLNLVFA